jgi:hypothetical protein
VVPAVGGGASVAVVGGGPDVDGANPDAETLTGTEGFL